jgi:hypothetical protein
MKPTAFRDTTMLLIYKNRVIKIAVNYHEGSLSAKARDALSVLLGGLKFI